MNIFKIMDHNTKKAYTMKKCMVIGKCTLSETNMITNDRENMSNSSNAASMQ